MGKQVSMVIDLHKRTGCQACTAQRVEIAVQYPDLRNVSTPVN